MSEWWSVSFVVAGIEEYLGLEWSGREGAMAHAAVFAEDNGYSDREMIVKPVDVNDMANINGVAR